MNSKKIPPKPKNKSLKSNIRIQPEHVDFGDAKHKDTQNLKVSRNYFLSWALVAAVSVTTLSIVVLSEGGIDDAIKTAGFKNINRQLAKNNFAKGSDNLPTASISTGGVNLQNSQSFPIRTVNNNISFVNEQAKNSRILSNQTSYSVFLGQGNNDSTVLNLWYSIKNQEPSLFAGHEASYYYDKKEVVYKLMIGDFDSLSLALQFCAKLKFNDIACKYDAKFVNLQTTLID